MGGRDFQNIPDPNFPRSRTFVAYTGDKIYACVTRTSFDSVTANQLIDDVRVLGFDPSNVVCLDGGGSTKMQAKGTGGGRLILGSIENTEVSSKITVRDEYFL